MEITLLLDSDVFTLLRRLKIEQGSQFDVLVNEALRRGLTSGPETVLVEPLSSYRLGTRPSINLTKSLAFVDSDPALALANQEFPGKTG